MPTVLLSGHYRFYFYSHGPNEPPHIHVDRDDLSAKFWLEPVGLARDLGFSPKELGGFKGSSTSTWKPSWRSGMGILALADDERVADVKFTRDSLSVALRDGRTITVPLTWYRRLLDASPAQRKNWRIAGGGYGIPWPDIDEVLGTEGLLRGAPAPRAAPGKTRASTKRPKKRT